MGYTPGFKTPEQLECVKCECDRRLCGCRMEMGMLNYVKDMRGDFREDRRRNLSEETGKLSVNSLVQSLCKSIDKVEHNGV